MTLQKRIDALEVERCTIERDSEYIRAVNGADTLEFFFPDDDALVSYRAERGARFDFGDNAARLDRLRMLLQTHRASLGFKAGFEAMRVLCKASLTTEQPGAPQPPPAHRFV